MAMTHRLYTPDATIPAKVFFHLDSVSCSPLLAHSQIANGLTTDVIAELNRQLEMDVAFLCRVMGIDRTTFQRRAKNADPTKRTLNSEQSAKVYLFVKAMDAAIGLFEGNKQKALAWLGKPARSLGMVCPIDMLSTPAGVEAVLDLVGQIEHGVVI